MTASEIYRGVPLHPAQSADRLTTVRKEIDIVFAEQEIGKLFTVAEDARWSPESRLLAAAKLEALHRLAVDERRERPAIDLDLVRASVAGLDSEFWRSPTHYGSLLDAEFGVERDECLEER